MVEGSHFSSLVILQPHEILILIVTTFLIGNSVLLHSYRPCFNEPILGPLETARFNHIHENCIKIKHAVRKRDCIDSGATQWD